MAAWKIAPALAAGNCTVVKPASPTPWSILKLAEVIQDVVPPGVVNIVTGPGGEIGKALASSPRIAKIGFTGETTTGRLIMQYAAQNLIPSTVELGGKSPNIFFADVMDEEDEYLDKAIEGLVLYAFNKGEVCTCPSRALIHESIYDRFMERCLARIAVVRQGNPLDPSTMIGPQVSVQQMEKIASYVEIGSQEGATCLIGGKELIWAVSSKAATTTSPPCSRVITVCGSSKRRSSVRCWPSPDSPTKQTPSGSPTTHRTDSVRACGPGTETSPTAWAARSKRVECGRTATTSTRPGPPLAGTRSRASAERITR